MSSLSIARTSISYDTINKLCRRIDTRIWIDWPEKLKNRLNRMLDRISLESSRVLDESHKSVKTLTMPSSCRIRFYLLLLCRFFWHRIPLRDMNLIKRTYLFFVIRLLAEIFIWWNLYRRNK